jgi:hypothetical protein
MTEQEYAVWKASGLSLSEYIEQQSAPVYSADMYAGFNPYYKEPL